MRSATTSCNRFTPASTQNTPRHPTVGISKPPMAGASAGMNPESACRAENARAAATPCTRSGTTARDTTITHPPARPWRKRTAISVPMVGASAHPTDVRKKITLAMTRGRLRPVPSEIAPNSRLPTAMPIMNAEMVSWTAPGVVPSSCCSCGRPGRYMSMDSGPADEKIASVSMSPAESWCTQVPYSTWCTLREASLGHGISQLRVAWRRSRGVFRCFCLSTPR